ncbi:PEP/pyruvate-binding domain-containing protein [Alkalibacter mobilis]|uniref:PEP/pyruvate-binding domain-containing protein n=1 Tax=Alkalibacter mobilis TaxID=2787712 RepID=UPI00189C6BFE|nr:PEP/pyruvate-binding domain-containing protein [Alkalibacter mobilis]MBF7095638.1 hypothetical protein [Alkalibacter mobilis]
MSNTEKTFSSKALEVNLSETRDDSITIPPEQIWFGELSKSQWGVYKRTQEFLSELNHKYRNNEYIIDSLQRICLGDLWIYNSNKESERALSILLDIIRSITTTVDEPGQKERLIQILLRFLDRLVSLENFPDAVVKNTLEFIESDMKKDALPYIKSSGYFKTYLKKVAAFPAFVDHVTKITGFAIEKSIEYWEATSKAEEWFKSKEQLFQSMTSNEISTIGRPFFRDLRKKRKEAKNFDDLEKLMFFNDISNYFRNFSESFTSHLEAVYYIFYLLHLPGMSSLSDHLMYDLNKNLRNIFVDLDLEDTIEFINGVMEEFNELKSEHSGTVLDCIVTLGREIIYTGDAESINHFIKSLMGLGFNYPGKITLTNDWQIELDSNHVKNIRIWLDLIETNPLKTKELLAALILHLKLGGVFISDTDLFQRDVTKLLNADITYVYREIKQLARIFPVFFREIGAEGDLREITTAIDEYSKRKDRLIHFLRKQVHTESNNSHINLTAQIINYWYYGDKSCLKGLIPDNVYDTLVPSSHHFESPNVTLRALGEKLRLGPDGLMELDLEVIKKSLDDLPEESQKDVQRVFYIFEVHSLLEEKYSFESADVLSLLNTHATIANTDLTTLEDALERDDHSLAVEEIYNIMNRLKEIILDPKKSEAVENIYYKRHIAAGIPSMYGEYKEPKFDALGLTYRLERVVSSLMDQVVRSFNFEYITAKTFRQIYDILILFKNGLELDGIYNQGLNSHLDMLKFGLASPSFSVDQYINIFEFMADDMKQIIQEYFFDIFHRPMKSIIPQIFNLDGLKDQDICRKRYLMESEKFLRDNLSTAFLVQDLDNFVTDIINALRNLIETYSGDLIQSMMHFDPDLTFSSLLKTTDKIDNPVFLGAKAYFLKVLKNHDFPVPAGFIISTEVFRHKDTIDEIPEMARDMDLKIDKHISEVESFTKKYFGDPNNPLFFSVRSGSSISMPGAMKTFLNVGMNDEIAEEFSKKKGCAWAAWDCYRRFLQSWGMAYGIERDVFDQIINDFKSLTGVDYKADFSAIQMKELAFSYKDLLLKNNIEIVTDPFKQLKVAINSVMDSWFSNTAVNYRSHSQVANEWGTAVIVQEMVLGNISPYSGSGVIFTSSPFNGYSGMNLYGDFALCSQGEDIVSGLVNTLPITEKQRKKHYKDSTISLESAFPDIYESLKDHANRLINDYGFVHQEIEFTFESRDPDDLYILQTRNQNLKKKRTYTTFVPSLKKMEKVGSGIGVSSGALSGLVAFNMDDINYLKAKNPGGKIILVRPDTVPDDIPLIFDSDGLITAKGGVTSHAAVTAANIGKICIVKCKDLKVNDKDTSCEINGHVFKAGDEISIDGSIGNIYRGSYDISEK